MRRLKWPSRTTSRDGWSRPRASTGRSSPSSPPTPIHITCSRPWATKSGRGGLALPLARRAVELSPGNADFHILTGVLLATTGQTEQAIESFRQAAALRPNDPSSLNNLANALRQAGRPEEAVDAYRQAMQIQPDFPEVYANMSNALLDLGRADEAIEACRKAITLQPGYSGAYNDMGNALRVPGPLRRGAGSLPPGRSPSSPSNADASFNLANLYREQGALDDALAAYRQALALRPNFPAARWHLALTQFSRATTRQGWEDFDSRLAVAPPAGQPPVLAAVLGRLRPGRPNASSSTPNTTSATPSNSPATPRSSKPAAAPSPSCASPNCKASSPANSPSTTSSATTPRSRVSTSTARS